MPAEAESCGAPAGKVRPCRESRTRPRGGCGQVAGARGRALWAAGVLALAWGCAPGEPPPFDGARAYADVVGQVGFGPRVPGTEAHRRCADWLVGRLGESTNQVSRQRFFHVPPPSPEAPDRRPDTLALYNIIASFRPEEETRIAICAHWDSRPFADEDPDSANHLRPIPGANDGASGVAVCLELARLLSQAAPPFGVDILLFDGEDLGRSGDISEFLIGSRWFVNRAPNYRPLAVILLDMVGDRDPGFPRERYSDSLAPGLTDLVWNTAARLGLAAFRDSVSLPVIDDHLPFLFSGVPAVDIIDFDYPWWHTVEDTPDKVAPATLDLVGTLLVELIYRTPPDRFRTRVDLPGPSGS